MERQVIGLLSKLPIDLNKIGKDNIDSEILRAGIIAELDAINLYEQMSEMAVDKHLKDLLLDIAREEKTHVGEFQALLLRVDKEQEKELEKGREEMEEILEK